jgi:hypothetical protein
MMEKRRKRGRKCGAEWLTAGGRRASERSRGRIKIFAPWRIRQICGEIVFPEKSIFRELQRPKRLVLSMLNMVLRYRAMLI